jgi:hypothetical protein
VILHVEQSPCDTNALRIFFLTNQSRSKNRWLKIQKRAPLRLCLYRPSRENGEPSCAAEPFRL